MAAENFTVSNITSAALLLSKLHTCLRKKQKCLSSEDVIRTIVRTKKTIACGSNQEWQGQGSSRAFLRGWVGTRKAMVNMRRFSTMTPLCCGCRPSSSATTGLVWAFSSLCLTAVINPWWRK